MLGLIVVSFGLLAAALAVLFWSRRIQAEANGLDSAAAVPLAQLADDAGAVARELGPGSFRQTVRIRGRIRCDSPLTSELSQTPCVAYRFSVTREAEEVLLDRNAQGEETQQVQRTFEIVATNEMSTSFWLDDGTTSVRVYPDGAKIDWVKTLSAYRPAGPQTANFAMGSFVLVNVPASRGILGYRYEEFCLPLDHEITVVAEAGDEGGQLALRNPEAKELPFLLSTRSFQELARGKKFLVSTLKGVSLGLAAVAVLIFILGVFR